MFDSTKDLLDRIRLGEDSLLELKEVRFSGRKVSDPHRDGLADEMAAFANARGGVCVLGVEDGSREVVGIPLEALDAVEELARSICQDSIKPPLIAVIERLWLPSADGTAVAVLKVDVPRGLFVHQSPGGYLHRVGSSKRLMGPEYLARLFQQRSQARITRFDEQAVPTARLEDLSEKLWERFRTGNSGAQAPEDFLNKLGAARQDEQGVWRPTVAGVLLATDDPRRFLPNAFIQAVAYAGASVSMDAPEAYQRDASDISGPLDAQVSVACRFVERNMRTAASKQLGRTDFPQYDLTAVFEALVNAVAHRDYAIYGSKIRLRMFADRLELCSPGALANTMTVDSLPLRQSARNEVVSSLLARCPVTVDLPGLRTERTRMMDKRGEGVPLILQRSLALSGAPAEYRVVDDEELVLTIHAAQPGS